jgi:hypothetical protein
MAAVHLQLIEGGKMRVTTLRLALPLVLVVLTGCASAGASASADVSQQLGTSTRSEAAAKTRVILQRHQYVLQREEGVSGRETNMYLETQWRPRTAFDDERALGAEAAETRIIVRARPRVRDGDVYTVAMTVENRVRMADGAWVTPQATREFTAYARNIADDLRRELLQGIRAR